MAQGAPAAFMAASQSSLVRASVQADIAARISSRWTAMPAKEAYSGSAAQSSRPITLQAQRKVLGETRGMFT